MGGRGTRHRPKNFSQTLFKLKITFLFFFVLALCVYVCVCVCVSTNTPAGSQGVCGGGGEEQKTRSDRAGSRSHTRKNAWVQRSQKTRPSPDALSPAGTLSPHPPVCAHSTQMADPTTSAAVARVASEVAASVVGGAPLPPDFGARAAAALPGVHLLRCVVCWVWGGHGVGTRRRRRGAPIFAPQRSTNFSVTRNLHAHARALRRRLGLPPPAREREHWLLRVAARGRRGAADGADRRASLCRTHQPLSLSFGHTSTLSDHPPTPTHTLTQPGPRLPPRPRARAVRRPRDSRVHRCRRAAAPHSPRAARARLGPSTAAWLAFQTSVELASPPSGARSHPGAGAAFADWEADAAALASRGGGRRRRVPPRDRAPRVGARRRGRRHRHRGGARGAA